MAPNKKTIGSETQSPLVTQKTMLTEQKRVTKVSWKESTMATECDRQRQLLVTLLTFSSRASCMCMQAAICAYDYNLEKNLQAAVDEAKLLYQQQ